MGITVHYRGSLAELEWVEDLEDRTIDLVLALGGNVNLWRSSGDEYPDRVVRGLILDLAPGQESTSLLISPEGWLIPTWEIEAAEKGQLTEPSWCFVKTQFGSLEGHVALVELLSCLKQEFFPDMEVRDESDYWEHRDVGILKQKLDFLSRAINSLGAALENDTLSSEAAEDPQILTTRIERIARLVHQNMLRPAEHAPVEFPENKYEWSTNHVDDEALWDEAYRENRRRQERIGRIIEKYLARGENASVAMEKAFEEVIGLNPLEAEEESGEDEVDDFNHINPGEDDEAWRSSLPNDEVAFRNESEPFGRDHPLLKRASDFLLSLKGLGKATGERSSSVDMLFRGAGEMCGGLAQALYRNDEWEADREEAGWRLVQLKRALRGAAFAGGAVVQLGYTKAIAAEDCSRWKTEIEAIESEIVDRLKELRGGGI